MSLPLWHAEEGHHCCGVGRSPLVAVTSKPRNKPSSIDLVNPSRRARTASSDYRRCPRHADHAVDYHYRRSAEHRNYHLRWNIEMARIFQFRAL